MKNNLFFLMTFVCMMFFGCLHKQYQGVSSSSYTLECLFVQGSQEIANCTGSCWDDGSIESLCSMPTGSIATTTCEIVHIRLKNLTLGQVVSTPKLNTVETAKEIFDGQVKGKYLTVIGTELTAELLSVKENGDVAVNIEFVFNPPPEKWEKFETESGNIYLPVIDRVATSLCGHAGRLVLDKVYYLPVSPIYDEEAPGVFLFKVTKDE